MQFKNKYFNTVFILLVSLCLNVACNGFNRVVKSKDFTFKLKKANEYFEAKKYSKAIVLYQELLNVFKTTEQFEFVFYRYAYCNYYLKDNIQAQSLFKEYLTRFPQSNKAEEIDFMHAMTFYLESPTFSLDQSSTIKTLGLMQIFVSTYPNSNKMGEALKVINTCKEKLEKKDFTAAELYFNKQQYKAASIYFNQLIQDFPESDKSEMYKLYSVKSLYEYAKNSITEKQLERYEHVKTDYEDFLNRFPESKYIAQLKEILILAEQQIKHIQTNGHLTQNEHYRN